MVAVRLSAAAEEDIVRLLVHTHERFGEAARRRYEALLVAGLADIAADQRVREVRFDRSWGKGCAAIICGLAGNGFVSKMAGCGGHGTFCSTARAVLI